MHLKQEFIEESEINLIKIQFLENKYIFSQIL